MVIVILSPPKADEGSSLQDKGTTIGRFFASFHFAQNDERPKIMAEELKEAIKEGQRIVREYLSQLGWARTSTQTAIRHIIPEWIREEREEIFRKSDRRLEDAEEKFGKEVDAYRKEHTEFTRKVLETIYNQLKNRNDLGFFAKKMVARLKEELYG